MKLNKFVAIVFCLASIFCAVSFAADEEKENTMVSVVAEGMGADQQEALKNAFKNAIYKAVGAFVISKTELDNEELDEKIVVNSDALVASHEVLTQKVSPSGLVTIKIRAQVEQKKFLEVLNQVTPQEISSTVVTGMLAKSDSLKEAKKSLTMLFEGFPYKLLEAKLCEDPHTVDTVEIKGKEQIEDGEYNVVELAFEITVNPKAYTEFATTLDGILSANCVRKDTIEAVDYSESFVFFGSRDKVDKDGNCFVVVVFPKNPKKILPMQNSSGFKVTRYLVRKELSDTIGNLQLKNWGKYNTDDIISWHIDFLDADGYSIGAEASYRIKPVEALSGSDPLRGYGVIVSPAMDWEGHRKITVKTKVILSESEIKEMATCSILLNGSYKSSNEGRLFR